MYRNEHKYVWTQNKTMEIPYRLSSIIEKQELVTAMCKTVKTMYTFHKGGH